MKLILLSLIVFMASLIQGATSFGFSLVALPLMGFLLNLKETVPLLVILSLLLNILIAIQLKKKPNFKEIFLMFLFGMLAIPLGVKLLIIMDEIVLKRAVGIFIIAVAILMIRGFRANIKNKNLALILTGTLSGLLNGSVSLSGPPIVFLLSNIQKDRDSFRISLTSLFILYNIFTVMLYLNKGLLSVDIMNSYLPILPFLFLGTFIGVKIGNKIDEEKFRQIVLYLLVIMGIINLF
ncbi:sulfite exporter TauE/SafE family protein [Fusibacter ferrireducens]|uniref:Probable membrane transporter protein n=1 Tax=Fusibacter ferrireducens TaxID=2785058 RepID=A0ABR9ZWM7_9FIRM|nr:sulfite exporter TauE/SafE family protein [Fusibacter ferrireducens]MBF4694853.1 sulfite exporter TauE/SafE family protein [Fusibacter ferrireducens]